MKLSYRFHFKRLISPPIDHKDYPFVGESFDVQCQYVRDVCSVACFWLDSVTFYEKYHLEADYQIYVDK